MKRFKEYVLAHFEQTLVLLILVSVGIINYFIPYKFAFLNLFYLPILTAAYYLGTHKALQASILVILMVTLYVYVNPQAFGTGLSRLDLSMNITAWAGFLVLTAAIVGSLHERLVREIRQTKELNEELTRSQADLKRADDELREYAQNLETKVVERTRNLERSKVAIEELKKKVEDALYATMDPAVVKLIIENRLRSEKRRISVLFADLKDFTVYSEERRAEMVITDLNRFLEEMESVIVDYRGHIDKYIGDAIMVEFGAPHSYDRHALLAVIAGVRMQERIHRGSFPWDMRVGISTGEPIMGLIGNRRQIYTAIGDAVNRAERIQKICAPGTVTVDGPTYEEVKEFVVAKQKTVLPVHNYDDVSLVRKITECVARLDENPQDADLLKKVGFLLMRASDPIQAHEYLKRALEIGPADDEVKLVYADATMRIESMGAIAVKGKKARLHLYEISGLRNPLEDPERVPAPLYQRYAAQVAGLVDYPEGIVLPVEALDGSVGHSRLVGFLAYALADALGVPESEKRDILEAGYLADIGKAIVPHHLLNRAGRLTQEEFREITKYPAESVRILRKMGYESDNLFGLVEHHHEDLNGGGFPAGLKGDEISLGCRVIAVAEAYAALTSWRPYRDRWHYRAAFKELEKDTVAGKYDPRVLKCLGELLGMG